MEKKARKAFTTWLASEVEKQGLWRVAHDVGRYIRLTAQHHNRIDFTIEVSRAGDYYSRGKLGVVADGRRYVLKDDGTCNPKIFEVLKASYEAQAERYAEQDAQGQAAQALYAEVVPFFRGKTRSLGDSYGRPVPALSKLEHSSATAELGPYGKRFELRLEGSRMAVRMLGQSFAVRTRAQVERLHAAWLAAVEILDEAKADVAEVQ